MRLPILVLAALFMARPCTVAVAPYPSFAMVPA